VQKILSPYEAILGRFIAIDMIDEETGIVLAEAGQEIDEEAVGRVKMNMRLDLDAPDTLRTLRKEDMVEVIRNLLKLRDGKGEVDDIDNLGSTR